MSAQINRGARQRVISLALAGGFAVAGGLAFTAGPAQATPGDPHKVWVCKYVKKPGVAETLKSGKNPIFVDWASLSGKQSAPHLGDWFSDAHFKSVVVQIGGSNPGVGACKVSTPPTTPPTTPKNPPKSNPPGGGGSGGGTGTPGSSAPHTGGAGDTVPINGLIGSGLLLAAAGIVGADALRRRRIVER
jgi:hypothetical protein